MKPHFIDHCRTQRGKMWNSKKDCRASGVGLKGQGRKPRRPKGGDKVGYLWTLLPGIGAMVFVWD